MGKLEYRSMISGVLYMGVVFLVIWTKEEQGQRKNKDSLCTQLRGLQHLHMPVTLF